MGLHRQGWLAWITLFNLALTVHCVSLSDLFIFGPGAGDSALEPGNDETQEFALDKPLHLFVGTFNKVYINTNGFISTAEPDPQLEYLGKTPARFGMIAAFLGDLDNSDGIGKVHFRQDTSPETLRQAADHINRAYPDDDEIQPVHAIVVTWENIAPHGPASRGDGLDGKRNTIQMVVASTEMASYAVLLYPREGVQFLSTLTGGESVPAEVGFSQGLVKGWLSWSSRQGQQYRVTTGEEASVRDLTEKTNSGRRGVWVYEIGTSPYFSAVAPGEVTDWPTEAPQERLWDGQEVEEEEPARENREGQPQLTEYSPNLELDVPDENPTEQRLVEEPYAHPIPIIPVQQHYPDVSQSLQPRYQPNNPQVLVVDEGDIDVDVFSYNFETCANPRQKCSIFADCRDFSSGYCCHCRPGYYGNGKHCVAEGKPQRMNGKVSGRVFVGNSATPVEFNNNDLHSYVVANDGRAYVAISTISADLGPSLLPLSSLGGVIGWAFALEQPGYENGFSVIGGEFTSKAEVTFLPGNEKLVIKQEFSGIDEHDHLVVHTELDGRLPEVPLGSTVQINPYSEIYQYGSNTVTSSSNRDYTVSADDGSTLTRSYQWRQTIVFQSCPHDEANRATPQPQQLNVDQVFVMYDAGNQLIRYAMSNKIGSVHGGDTEQNACFTGRHGCDTNAVCRPGQGNQFTCQCAAGFTGDGRTCYDVDECRENLTICGHHAICNNQPGTFRCECIAGFQFAGDGQTCVEVDGPVDHCRSGTHNCDVPERARCSYTGGSAYICSCLPGFEGSGQACQDIDECRPSRCHQDAVCHNTQGSFTCQCRPGFHGDGFRCSPASSERQKTQCERHRESAQAQSIFGPRGPRPAPGQYVPTCNANGGYEPTQCHASTRQCWCVDGNGLEIPDTRTGPGGQALCIDQSVLPPPVGPTPRPDVSPLSPGTHLLFAQSGKIEHIPLEGYDLMKNEAKTLLHLPDKVIIGVAYDCMEKMVYWTDITGPSISRASLQGGNPEPLITLDLESPEGIAIDHLGRTMFWTDSMRDRIEVASLDGSQRRVLLDVDLVNPRPIVTDSVNGYLYWADWNRDAPKIEASYMDGTNRRVLVKDDLGLPNALTFDPQTSLLCWADAGTRKVECMNPNQGIRRKVLEGIQYPFGITSYGRNLYYTDWRRDAVIVANRPEGREMDEFQPQKRTRLYGISTAYAQCPSGQNYCGVNNGGCTHLCLATPSGRSCRCPDNAVGVGCVEREGGF